MQLCQVAAITPSDSEVNVILPKVKQNEEYTYNNSFKKIRTDKKKPKTKTKNPKQNKS